MAIWTIEVVNETGAAQDFFVFSQPPEVRFAGQAVAVHPCAWITYPGVQPGERRRSTFSESISIYVDLNGAKPAPGVVRKAPMFRSTPGRATASACSPTSTAASSDRSSTGGRSTARSRCTRPIRW